ncbi:hypothetical protein [Marinobacter alexandrii]|uniref:hypothetical protein n=1 Tax=Marinobacter alexandrii TaxID=2570351 RepID=UPI00329955EE
MKKVFKPIAIAVGLLSGSCLSLVASADGDLGAAATNPVANLVQFRIQNQYAPESYNADSWSNATLMQMVAPLPSIADKFDALQGIVTRTTVPFVSTPKLDNGINRKNGLSDTQMQVFFVPEKSPKKTVWGIGPAFTFPTAGDNEFTGSGQWQAGPAAVAMVTPVPGVQLGALVFQQWDFHETRSDAKDVSILNVQPIIFKHFDGGWYIGGPDVPQTYNWETNDWTLALGGTVGRVGPVFGKPMQLYGGVYYNTENNDEQVSSEWIFKVNFGFLFPK